jgi:hypothetical protein
MANPAPAQDLGAHLTIKPLQSCAEWLGTRAQLEAEGFIPPGTAWPQGHKPTRFETTANLFCLYLRSTHSAACSEPIYKVYQYSHAGPNCLRIRINAKLRELAVLASFGSEKWSADNKRFYQARGDAGFQAFKRALLGQKKPGRKPSNTTSNTTPGASHV